MSGDPNIRNIYNREHERLENSTLPAGGMYVGDDPPAPPLPGTLHLEDAEGVGFVGIRSILSNVFRRINDLNVSHLHERHTQYAVTALEENEENFDDEAVAQLAKAI